MIDIPFLFNRYFRHAQRIDGLLWDYPTKEMLLRHEEPFLDEFILRKGDVFVDVGANVGAWSIRASRFYKTVYAFEPNKSCYDSLKRNIHLNRRENIIPHEVALDQEAGVIPHRIHSPEEKGGQMAWDTVLSIPLDKIMVLPVSLMKIDVEGAGQRVINGAKKTIQKWKPTLIIEVHNQDESTIPASLNGYRWEKRYRDATPIGDWLYRENGKQVFLIGSVRFEAWA